MVEKKKSIPQASKKNDSKSSHCFSARGIVECKTMGTGPGKKKESPKKKNE